MLSGVDTLSRPEGALARPVGAPRSSAWARAPSTSSSTSAASASSWRSSGCARGTRWRRFARPPAGSRRRSRAHGAAEAEIARCTALNSIVVLRREACVAAASGAPVAGCTVAKSVHVSFTDHSVAVGPHGQLQVASLAHRARPDRACPRRGWEPYPYHPSLGQHDLKGRRAHICYRLNPGGHEGLSFGPGVHPGPSSRTTESSVHTSLPCSFGTILKSSLPMQEGA